MACSAPAMLTRLPSLCRLPLCQHVSQSVLILAPFTAQAHLFAALKKACLVESRETASYSRCGRTDKGVSAFSQVSTPGRSRSLTESMLLHVAIACAWLLLAPYCRLRGSQVTTGGCLNLAGRYQVLSIKLRTNTAGGIGFVRKESAVEHHIKRVPDEDAADGR